MTVQMLVKCSQSFVIGHYCKGQAGLSMSMCAKILWSDITIRIKFILLIYESTFGHFLFPFVVNYCFIFLKQSESKANKCDCYFWSWNRINRNIITGVDHTLFFFFDFMTLIISFYFSFSFFHHNDTIFEKRECLTRFIIFIKPQKAICYL